MPKIMKPSANFKESVRDGFEQYSGPVPPAGVYKGKVTNIYLIVKDDGEQRLMVWCKISQDGKYKGAELCRFMQITEKGASWVNSFLISLTDGSEKQSKAIREAFWDIGFEVGEPTKNGYLPITKIGKKTDPRGVEVTFSTKVRDGRAEIVSFLAPVAPEGSDDSTDQDEDEILDGGSDDDSGDDDVASSGDLNLDPWDAGPDEEDSE